MGANHNFWNTEWAVTDDWGFDPDKAPCGTQTPGRLTAAEQQAIGRAYIAGFFRLMLGGETTFARYFDGSGARPPAASDAVVHTVAQAPARTRLDVSRFDRPLPAGAVSGDVTATPCATALACVQNEQESLFPHWVSVLLVPKVPNPAVTALRWTGRSGVVRLPVPRRNVSSYAALSFRAAPDPASTGEVDLTVRVIDGDGRFKDVAVSAVSGALVPLPGLPEHAQPKTLFAPCGSR